MKKKKRFLSVLLSLVLLLGLISGMSLTAYADDPYASLKNTTTVVHFDSKDWYLIDYDASTVTLLAKECVGVSTYNSNGSYVAYDSDPAPDVKNAVDNYYNTISGNAKTAVSGSRMFLLTREQATPLGDSVRRCLQPSGTTYGVNAWWLCSQGTSNDNYAAFVKGDQGNVIGNGTGVSNTLGVRPALKLDLSKVVFDSNTKEFNLLEPYPIWVGGVQVTSAATSGNGWSYDVDTHTLTLSGADITEGYYFEDNTWGIFTNNNSDPLNIVLEEGTENKIGLQGNVNRCICSLNKGITIGGNGSLTMGGEYSVFSPASINIEGGTVDINAKSGIDTNADVTIGTGTRVTIAAERRAIRGTVKNAIAGTGWTDKEGTEGETAIEISTEGQDISNYKKVVFVAETATVTAAPVATNPVYNGSAQELVTAGTAEGGTIQYALGTASEATESYTESIPTGTEVGTYYVWYKAVGDAYHLDSDPQCVQSGVRPSNSYVPYKAPTATEPGNKAYYIDGDGKMYWDALGLLEIADPSEVIIPPTGVKPADNSGSGSSSSGGSGGGGGGGGASGGGSGMIVISSDGNKQYLSSVSTSSMSAPAESGGNWNYDTSDKWYYTRPDGSTPRNEWVLISYQGVANWYAFDENGAMRTGWFSNNGETYYLEQQHNGAQGEMTMGWKLIGDRWYYFEPATGIRQGRMYHGEKTPDGYVVGEDGGWDGNPAMIGR